MLTREEYFKKAKFMWNEYVPKSGQSQTVQGELIRSIEKLRDEAQRNGNINWNSTHEKMAKFIRKTLINSSCFNDKTIANINTFLDAILNYNTPYTGDDGYDYLTDRIVDWYIKNIDPIPLGESDLINYTDSEGVSGVIGNPEAHKNELKLALNLSDEEMVRAAIENGVDIESKGDFDNTPLSQMATVGNVPMLKLLVELGANINAINSIGWSVLDMAKHQKEAKKYLKSIGAKSAQKGEIG